MMTPEQVAGGGQWIDTSVKDCRPISRAISLQPVNFREAYGFAFITDADPPDLAQGYLAVCTNCK